MITAQRKKETNRQTRKQKSKTKKNNKKKKNTTETDYEKNVCTYSYNSRQ